MWILIENEIQEPWCVLINVGDSIEYDNVGNLLQDLGYDISHLTWNVFDSEPSFERYRYDEELNDLVPIY